MQTVDEARELAPGLSTVTTRVPARATLLHFALPV